MSPLRMLPSVRVFINLIEVSSEHETKTRVDGIHVKICLLRRHQRTVKAIVLVFVNETSVSGNNFCERETITFFPTCKKVERHCGSEFSLQVDEIKIWRSEGHSTKCCCKNRTSWQPKPSHFEFLCIPWLITSALHHVNIQFVPSCKEIVQACSRYTQLCFCFYFHQSKHRCTAT